MVLKGVDEIDWFTDRPDRVEGIWKPQKLLRKWDKYYASSEPNAQVTFDVGEQRKLFAFEMYKPKIKSGKMVFNIKTISASAIDKFNDFVGKGMEKVSVFIDGAAADSGLPSCFPDCHKAQLSGINLSKKKLFTDFSSADLSYSYLTGADLTRVDLTRADLSGAYLTDAYLNDANLREADLNGANLFKANLFKANLFGANLTGVVWGDTFCPNGTLNDGTSPCTAEQLLLA